MNARSFLILAGIAFIGLVTRNIFWAFLAGIVFLFYALSTTASSFKKGATRSKIRAKTAFHDISQDMERTTGKYPSTFFEDAGKAITDKIGESIKPPGARSHHDATENFRWGMKDPGVKIGNAVQKFLDGLAKLFGR